MAGSRRGWITDVFQSWKQQDLLGESGCKREKRGIGSEGRKSQGWGAAGAAGEGVPGAPLTRRPQPHTFGPASSACSLPLLLNCIFTCPFRDE